MTISIDVEKAFDKIQHDKVLLNEVLEGIQLNRKKVAYENPTVSIIRSGEKLDAITLKSGT